MALKEALKEVSLEHNNAMEEQQKRFQKELDALRKALEQGQTVSRPNGNDGHDLSAQNNLVVNLDNDDTMDIDAGEPETTQLTMSLVASPKHKSPKRSKSRSQRDKGGPASANDNSNL